MQPRAAGAVYGARVLPVERDDVAGDAGRIVEIDVGQTFPTAADPGDFGADRAAAVHNCLNNGIQPRDVAATGENADSFLAHNRSGRKLNHYCNGSGVSERGKRVRRL